MISDKGILIKNVYYMLSYAFQVLKQSNYDEIAAEEFDNIHDLLAAILARGIAQQLKHGLYREYITHQDDLAVLRGKLNIAGTINNKLQRKQLLTCEYDDLSENNLFNQILKVTSVILMSQQSVSNENKLALKKVMLFFTGVDEIEPTSIKWSSLRYQRNNQNYKMLLNLCYFVLDGLLLTTDRGTYKMAEFLDDLHMSKLYEKFILCYYKQHYPQFNPQASQIAWNVDDGIIEFLPKMQTDITLRSGDRSLIIDAKYYARTMQVQQQFDSYTLHSHNLYQIFTYVKNMDVKHTGQVSGLLLYAKTEEAISPDSDFTMDGNKISVKTLDLNRNFGLLASQLDKIAEQFKLSLEDCSVIKN